MYLVPILELRQEMQIHNNRIHLLAQQKRGLKYGDL